VTERTDRGYGGSPGSATVGGPWQWLAEVVGALPWSLLPWLGGALGWIAGTALRIRRFHVEDGMRQAGIGAVARQANAMYRSLGTSVFEFLWLAARRGREATEHVSIDAESRVLWDRAVAGGRGVVVAASHTGNWDLAACAMARRLELLVVTKRLSIKTLDDFWQSTRARRGVTLAPPDGAMGRARAILRRAGAVAMMIDQVPACTRHATHVDFLGRAAWTERSAAALAARSGAPLVVAACRRHRGGRHVLYVLRVLWPPERALRAWVDRATAEATLALGDFVRAHPSDWLWLHRRWRTPEARAFDRAIRGATLAPSWTILSSSQGAHSRVD
jgi:KDO2-lipid IV(A) lauroyltransferase